jgi:hypothetical protein
MGEKKRTIEVCYSDGEMVLIKAVAWMQTDDLWDLLKLLLANFSEKQMMLGEFLRPSNKAGVSTLRKIAKMFPLVGGGDLQVERMESEEILRLFLFEWTEGEYVVNEFNQIVPPPDSQYPPGAIARLHGFDFFDLVKAARDYAKTLRLKAAEEKDEPITTLKAV